MVDVMLSARLMFIDFLFHGVPTWVKEISSLKIRFRRIYIKFNKPNIYRERYEPI
jgi:hypothetical protein